MEIVKLCVNNMPFDFYRPTSFVPCVICHYNNVTKGIILSINGNRVKIASCEKCAKLDGEKLAIILKGKAAFEKWLKILER